MHIKQLLTKKKSEMNTGSTFKKHLPLFRAECPVKIESCVLSFILPADEVTLALFAVFIICYHTMLSRKKVYINTRKSDDSVIVVIMACKLLMCGNE